MTRYDGARDGGSVTLLMTGVIAAEVLLCCATVAGCAALSTRHVVAAAADSAALAASSAALGRLPGEPCSLAAEVVTAHGVQLATCTVEGFDAVVSATALTPFGSATVSARAGPVSTVHHARA